VADLLATLPERSVQHLIPFVQIHIDTPLHVTADRASFASNRLPAPERVGSTFVAGTMSSYIQGCTMDQTVWEALLEF